MALFRFQRGSLSDSLKTTVIVKNLEDVKNQIISTPLRDCINIHDIKIYPYPDKECNFDDRIGWYTHIVSVKYEISSKPETHQYLPIGFLSEPID